MALPSQIGTDLRVEGPRDGLLKLILTGRLDSATTGTVWRRTTAVLTRMKPQSVLIDASGVDYCDGAGIALLVHLRLLQGRAGGTLQIDGLRPEFASLLDDAVPDLSSRASRGNEDLARAAAFAAATMSRTLTAASSGVAP